jgi:uncharacterized protein
MRALLDVNTLLALFDSGHLFHGKARKWWGANMGHGWASSPLTQNGFVRIISQPRYERPVRLPDAVKLLQGWAVPPHHGFWADDLSLLDAAHFDHTRLLTPRQITDVYLLALAAKHGGRLVTFDRGISLAAAPGASASNLVVLA